MQLYDELVELLDRTDDDVKAEESANPEYESLASSERFVVYGAGIFGRKILSGLLAVGREVVCVCDQREQLWNTKLCGIDVKSPRDAVELYGKSALFVVCVWNSELGICDYDLVRSFLLGLGCKKIAPAVPLLRMYPEQYLPHWRLDKSASLLQDREKILQAFGLWEDDASRSLYVEEVRFNLLPTFNIFVGASSMQEQYFPERLISLTDRETFVDCGAYDGDTARELLLRTNGRFNELHCFEPDPLNVAKLLNWKATAKSEIQDKIYVWDNAVGDRASLVTMDVQGSETSSIVLHGQATVQCVRLDDVLSCAPTYVKFDIEGYEPLALTGSTETIRAARPKIAICVYHYQKHLWDIPLQLHAIANDYSFHLVHHGPRLTDVVCYVLPAGRPLAN